MRTVDPVMHEAKRRQIVDAAAGLFAAKGFEATTTAEICRAAGMSSGNVFHYFASKRDIFEAVLVGGADDTAEQLAAALATDDPFEALLGFVDHLAAGAAFPGVPGLVLEAMLQAVRDPDLAERLDQQDQDEEAGVAALLVRAAEAGHVDPGLDVAHAASWVMTLVGALYLRGATSEAFDPAAELPTLRLVVTRFLRGGSSGGSR